MLIAKPFEISNNILVSLANLQKKNQKLVLEEENIELIEKINKNNFLEYENFRLKKLLNIDEENYSEVNWKNLNKSL